MNLSANVVHLILTLLIPLAVAFVTKASASAALKAIVSIVLAAVVTLITRSRLGDGSAVLSYQVVYDWVITTAVAVASYLGVYKPVLDINEKALPDFGIG